MNVFKELHNCSLDKLDKKRKTGMTEFI